MSTVRDGGHFTFGGERAFYKFRAAAPRAVLRELGRGSADGGGDLTIWLLWRVRRRRQALVAIRRVACDLLRCVILRTGFVGSSINFGAARPSCSVRRSACLRELVFST